MRKISASLLLGLLALMVCATPALAGRTWCAADPIIKVDGQVIDVLVSSYTEMNTLRTGPVKLVITVPVGSSASVYATDNGFGYGYSITIQQSSTLKKTATATQIQAAVYAPATDRTLPVKVDIKARSVGPVGSATAQGYANAWVTAKTR